MPSTISICIPSYNCERYVRTTIESALGQTVPPVEILISDDQSTDRSLEIIQEYARVPGVRILRPPQRTTLGGHYRFLLQQAAGDYICFLSADDALMPDFIKTMQGQLTEDGKVCLVSAACLETDSRLKPRKTRGTGTPRRPLDAPAGLNYFAAGCHYTISFSLLARRMLLDLPPIPAAGDLATDWCWALILGARGRIKFVRRPLGYYRIHASNAGHDRDQPWQEASAVMLQFARVQLDPAPGEQLQSTLDLIHRQIADRCAGLASHLPPPTALAQLKTLVKSALARRYRRLPAHIARAEQGISTALRRLPMP